jgi:alpha-amylase
MRKGVTNNQIISLWTNRGFNSGTINYTINGGNAGFGPGWYMTDVVGCGTYVADRNGNLAVNIVNGAPVVLFPTQALGGSGICGR